MSIPPAAVARRLEVKQPNERVRSREQADGLVGWDESKSVLRGKSPSGFRAWRQLRHGEDVLGAGKLALADLSASPRLRSARTSKSSPPNPRNLRGLYCNSWQLIAAGHKGAEAGRNSGIAVRSEI